jgi:hypothetical protein
LISSWAKALAFDTHEQAWRRADLTQFAEFAPVMTRFSFTS